MRKYLVVAGGILMLSCLGGAHAWSAFDRPLRGSFGFSAAQTQLVFGTFVFTFCMSMILTGRLHDRLGPRPLGILSAVLTAAAYLLAWRMGGHFGWLWLSMGVLGGVASAAGYVCPIATAAKWFPSNKGLICGMAAAGFASGPILMSAIAKGLLSRGWFVLDIFGLIAAIYGPAVLLAGLLQVTPAGAAPPPLDHFRRRNLLTDRRFWMIFVGMLCGTAPYLMIMGSVEPLTRWFGLAGVAAFSISLVAGGNAAGRVFWGYLLDRFGQRAAMLGTLGMMAIAVAGLLLGGHCQLVFVICVIAVGFCYGSCFAIYPATVARTYGLHVMGSVYPLVMAAQGISSTTPAIAGLLYDLTASYSSALVLALAVPVVGLAAVACLGRSEK